MNLPRFGLGARLSALHASAFIGIGVYMPFFPIWLEHRSLGPSTIGFILALPVLIRIVATAPLMMLVDRGVGAGRLMITVQASLIAVYAALYVADGAWTIALLVATMAVLQAPVVPTSDLVTMEGVRENPGLDYGRIRLWGSVSFLGASIVTGHVLGGVDPDAVVWILAALAAAGIIVWRGAMPRVAVPPGRTPSMRDGGRSFPASLRYVIAAAALTQASHAAVYGFGSLYWREAGLSSAVIGYLWAVGVIAEILLFAYLGSVVGKGRAAFGFLIVGACAGVVRFAAMAVEPNLAVTFVLQALHGLSFGATHLGTIAALAWLAPGSARGRAQGVFSSSAALAMAAGTIVSGFVFRAAGPLVFLVMVPLAAAGLVCALLAMRAEARQPQREEEGG
jgi:MFS transporter, PPP family, 3-phenylpropionic acid transporter